MMPRRRLRRFLIVAPILWVGMPSAAQAQNEASIIFQDVTQQAGIDFVHDNGATGRKHLPEIMGSGGCALDFDGDGWIDLYLVQSGSLPGAKGSKAQPVNRLFRNRGDGTFEDVTRRSGAGDSGYGMGCVASDYDNDGDPDLYLVNFGPDVLLQNKGDGTFADVTAQAGIDSPLWGSSAAFFDADLDGDLDLYVVNYLEFRVEEHIDCGSPSKGFLSYCHPDAYPMSPDAFFLNRGDGTFEEATAMAGFTDRTGKGLGVVAADFNNDHRPDVYVANDSTPNFLYLNQGEGHFEESALFWGVGYNENGLTEAGMGVDAGDVNGDGLLDIVVTNLSQESNALYLGGAQEYSYHSRKSGLYEPSLIPVGFGVDLLDLDNDGDLDLFVSNGHVIDNIERIDDAQTFRQPSQAFRNDGEGNFAELPAAMLAGLSIPRVGRATVTLDYDNDGRLDVLVSYNNDRARLFRNLYPRAGNWIGFILSSQQGNRDALGARVRIESGGRAQTAERISASSYQSSNDPRLHFGLGSASQADQVTIRWPSGKVQILRNLSAGRYHRIAE
ncbi:MAG: CRTAC1 family protein [Acidobacteriota bacterium]